MRTARFLIAAAILLAAGLAPAAPEQDHAFLKVWRVHQTNLQDHEGVVAAAQTVMDKTSTLGDYLPAVKTLVAWHFLAAGKRADAERLFESALLKNPSEGNAIARTADAMARRWLSRIDAEDIVRALRRYYADHVEYPPSLAPLFSTPAGRALKTKDRFGDPWVYRIETFEKLPGAKNQRYALYSRSIGKAAGLLKSVPFRQYGRVQAILQGTRRATPVTCTFATRAPGGAVQTGLATEGGLVNGLRFLKLASDADSALLAEAENDYWCVAFTGR